jgi:hypothetical protein
MWVVLHSLKSRVSHDLIRRNFTNIAPTIVSRNCWIILSSIFSR